MAGGAASSAPPSPACSRRLQVLAQHVLPAGRGLGARTCAGLPAAVPASGAQLVLRPRALAPADVIFGCGPLYNPEQAEADAAVHAALAAGVVGFDTAPLYGSSEDVLGRALAASPLGEGAVVYTKVGKLIRRLGFMKTICSQGPSPWSPFAVPQEERAILPDYSAAGARRSHRESLERMGLGRCHTLRLHDPDSIEGATAEAIGPDGLVGELVRMREEGAIENVSLGMNANADHVVVTPGTGGAMTSAWGPSVILDIIRAVPVGTFDSALFAYGWNLACQDAWPVFQECAARGIKVHVAGVFGGVHHINAGMAAMKGTREEHKSRAASWRGLAAKHGVSLKAVAVAFAALPSVVDKVVMGMKSAKEVEENLAAVAEAERVPAAIWAEARAAGLLGPLFDGMGAAT